MPDRLALILSLVGLTGLCGCLPSQQGPAEADLRANDTPSRVPAIVHAAQTDDDKTLTELVQALSDKDPAVRLFAVRSLQERTGENFGYRYYDPPEKRQAATNQWHAYLNDPGATKPATTDSGHTTE